MLRRYPAEHVLAVLRKFGQEITDPDEIARIERMFDPRKDRLH
ncbi:quinolinate synthase NadA [Mesorhizobium sp. M00.F.Ca.ET.216.01.1.1]|nr:quinolinate synthase NadA [Mesorhizobium sp. M00.F.Ca.ET.216.01.1.1]